MPRYLAWTTVPQSREYSNMAKPYERLLGDYWAEATYLEEESS